MAGMIADGTIPFNETTAQVAGLILEQEYRRLYAKTRNVDRGGSAESEE